MLEFFPAVTAQIAREIKTHVKGEVTTAFSVQTAIQIVEPQPVRETELKLDIPGERITNYRKTWTREAGINTTDEIEYAGVKYRVFQVENRTEYSKLILREKVPNVA